MQQDGQINLTNDRTLIDDETLVKDPMKVASIINDYNTHKADHIGT